MNQQSKHSADFMIVGQGIAGTLLAHFLIKRGKKIILVDDAYSNASSRLAAGIINPITGRRFVKSWMVDRLLPFAKETYGELEAQFGVKIYNEKNILRALSSSQEDKEWLLRTGDPGYAHYMLEEADWSSMDLKINQAFSYGELQHAAQVDFNTLISCYRRFLRTKHVLLEEAFSFETFGLRPGQVSFKGHSAKAIIFCEGAKAAQNPFFNFLPFNLLKGEGLIISIKGKGFKKILKQKIFLVPLSNGLYWAGASYDYKNLDENSTQKGRDFLIAKLDEILKVPYTIKSHFAALRPTVKHRRPLLGSHPDFSELYIFNGLGTKGASLAPFWAKQLADHLIDRAPLDEEVDIKRYFP